MTQQAHFFPYLPKGMIEALAATDYSWEMKEGGNSAFPTTRWTLLLELQQTAPRRRQALEQLCQAYWYPLYAFARQRGRSPEEAEDATQAFFLELLSGNGFERADADRGKLRSYLLGGMTRFLAKDYRRENAQKRGGGEKPVSIDADFAESRIVSDFTEGASPEKVFDQRWAQTILNAVGDALKEEYSARGRAAHYEALSDYLFWNSGDAPYSEVSAQLGLSEPAVRQTVSRMRKRFAEILRQRVAFTVEDESLVDEEIRELLSAFSQGSGG